MPTKLKLIGFTTAATFLLLPALHAGPIQLTSASQLNTTATSVAIVSAAQPIGYVSSGNSLTVGSSDRLTFSRTSGQFEIDQAGYNYGDTAFTNGTNLVGAGGFQGAGDGGPVTITFAQSVVEFGLNIEDYQGGAYGITFTAKDASGQALGTTYAATGNDALGGAADLLSFEGLYSVADPIESVTFTSSLGSGNLLFGNIAIQPVQAVFVGGPGPAAVTPEPASLVLLGTGLLGAVGIGRKRRISAHQ